MEFLTVLLSSFLALISPVGLVVDRTVQTATQAQFANVQQLHVRVEHVSLHQLLAGKVKRVRVAGREMQLKQYDLRIAALELETDAIDLNLRRLRQNKLKLQRSLQAGVRLVLTQQDVNQALRAQPITDTLLDFEIDNLNNGSQKYRIVKPKIEFLANNRVRVRGELNSGNPQPLAIKLESGLKVISGRKLQLIAPVVSVDGEEVPKQIVNAIAQSLSDRLDLKTLESYGLQARILQLKITPENLEIAIFVRVEPSSRLLEIALVSM